MATRTRLLPTVLLTAGLVLGSGLTAPPAQAATTYVWSGLGTTDSWTEAANWSPSGVPGTGDSVTVMPPATGSCNAHVVDAPGGITLQDLTLAFRESSPGSICGASLAGGALSVAGTYDQNGAVLTAPLTLTGTATGTIRSDYTIDVHSQLNADVTVFGTLTLQGNLAANEAVYLGGGKHLTIAATGTLVSSGQNQVTGTACCVDPPRVINNGTLQATGGALRVTAAALAQNGVLDTTTTGSLKTDRAPSTSSSGASYTGSGSWELGVVSTTTLSGTQTLGDDFSLVLGGAGISGTNELAGTFTLAGGGTFEWRGGLIQAAMTIAPAVTLLADGNPGAGRYLKGRDGADNVIEVTNHGTATFTNGAEYYNYAGHLVNAADGTLNLGAGTLVSGDCCVDPGVVRNNDGDVVIGGGALPATADFVSFVMDGGTLTIPSGQTLDTTGGGTDELRGTIVKGGGVLDIASPTTVAGTISVATGTTLRLKEYRGTLDGTATIAGAGRFVWSGGAMSGAITVKPTGGSTITGPVDPVNDPLFKYVTPKAGNKPSSVKFTGTTKVVGGSTAVPTAIDLGVSTLTFGGATTIGPDVTIRYGKVVGAGSLRVTSTGAHPFTVTALTTTGTLTGSATIVGAVVNSTGTVSPGDKGTGSLRIKGSYQQKAGGELLQKLLKGAGPLLSVNGTAKLAGHLLLSNGYLPALGSSRAVLTATGTLTSSLSCTATTGLGTSGAKAAHWTTSVAGHQLKVKFVKGRKAGC